MMTNATTALITSPYLNVLLLMVKARLLKSGLAKRAAMSGVSRSLTNACTTVPKAAPTTMPTARSITLPRSRNALNPDTTDPPFRLAYVGLRLPAPSARVPGRGDLIHMRWAEFATAAPEMAALGREQLEAQRVVLIATVRRDGSPRISGAEPVTVEGDLYLGMMWRSRKALDLRRDPRLLIHNPICSNAGDEVEFSLRGQAIEVHDAEVRRRF